jgi:outer membrane protein
MQTFAFRSTLVAAAAMMIAAPAAFAQAASGKIVYINSQRILADAPGRAEAEKTFETEAGAARTQLQKMDDSLKSLVAAFEKEAPKLDSATREKRAGAVREREQEFSERAQGLNQQMQQRQAELVRPLMDQVTKVLEEMRVSGNYAMILDVASQGNVIVSADKSLDISEQVLARLKQLGPPKPGAAPAAAPTTGPSQRPAGVTRPRN